MCGNRKGLCLSLAALGVALGLLLLAVPASGASDLTVCPSGPPDCQFTIIQAAVDAAAPGDTIKVASGLYTDVQSRASPPGYNGPNTIRQVVFFDKSLTLRGGYSAPAFAEPPDPVANPTTLDALGLGRVLFVAPETNVTIEGLHITGGDATGLGGSGDQWDTGGAAYALTATVTLTRTWIFGNTARQAGGVYLRESSAQVWSSTVYGNAAIWSCGGLCAEKSSVALIGNVVYGNTAGEFGGGGVLLYQTSGQLTGNTITANTANEGGGVALSSSPVTLTRNTIAGNSTSGDGGGLSLYKSDATLIGNKVTGNSTSSQWGGGGGGLTIWYSAPLLANNMIADNQANAPGTALWMRASSPALVHNTLARNVGGDGSALYVNDYNGVYCNVVLTNTILVEHSIGIRVEAGSTATLEATLWGNDTDWQGPGSIIIGTRNYWGDPVFLDPGAGDYHLLPTSAAIDHGVPAGVTTDIDDEPRPMGGGYDLGADEAPIPVAPILSPISNPDGDGDYLLDWNDVTRATGYTLEEDDNAGFASPTNRYAGADSQFQVTDQAGGTWYYRVRANNAYGSSPWSNTQSVGVSPSAPVLAPIGNPGGDGDYLVNWNDVTGATGYTLQEDEYPTFPSPATRYQGSSSQFQVTGQPSGTWYYRVYATNDAGVSPWSNVESVGVAPPAPTLLPIDNDDGDGAYLVEWTGALGATAYTLEEDGSPDFPSPTTVYQGTLREYQVLAQGPGTWYYRVKATNPGGSSPWSNVQSASVIPDVPVLMPISNSDGDGDFLVDWSEAAGAAVYTLQEDDNPGFGSPMVRYLGGDSQYEATGLSPGTWYFRVRASNPGGDSPWSNTESVVVDEVPLEAPLLLPISNPNGDGNYLVDWSSVPGATSYVLQLDDNQGFASPDVAYEGAATQVRVEGQPIGTWHYRVRAFNGFGGSPWSQAQSVTVLFPPPPPTVYLPLVFRARFHDPYEPNDSFEEAWGPLASGGSYHAYFPAESDMSDYYYLHLTSVHGIDVWLREVPAGNDYALYLYDAAHVLVGYSDEYGTADEHIALPGASAGRYYVRIERVEGTSRTQPYALEASFQ